ncbi:MAG: aldehyde dehydrogenase family protein [Eubacteriaceae bacterium]|nr:aldehyde dehydrogenase family protein [Eubacteriaceae bacterium]
MSNTLTVTNPCSNEVVGTVALPTAQEVDAMVEKSVAAQVLWAKQPLWARTKLLYKFCDAITENTEDIAVTLCKEMGKPIEQARMETGGSANIARGFIERANHLYGEVLSTENQPGFENDLIFTMREPLGVIACVIPFNYPIELFVHKVVPALIMGNSVVVKAPTDNPLAMLKLGALFEKIGAPENLVQCMACERDIVTEHLLQNKHIAAISLTGSSGAGVQMAQCAAPTLKHLCLELGGNDGNIIRQDADLDYAVSEMIAGRIFNAGQTCCACKRFIVHESIKDELAEKLVAALKKLNVGDAMDPKNDMSTVVSAVRAKKVIDQVEYTIGQGAKCIYGGTRDGAFVTPTVLVDVDKSYDIASDLEIFGPVFPIIPYKTDEEALEILNNCSNGLSSGIITKDLKQAMRMAAEIKSGACVLNGQSSYRHMEQPFGGYKMTGIGREGVSATLEEHSQIKSYIVKGVFNK